MEKYPEIVTERFDSANFHIKYCLRFIKRYLKGNILEVGAGCGSFTKNYFDKIDNINITLTEPDKKNYHDLIKKFQDKKNIEAVDQSIDKINKKFDTIMYLHVLEHIKDDVREIKNAIEKLNPGGMLIIMVPAHQSIYSRLDKEVGHFRRYEKDFFPKKLYSLNRVNFKFLDSMGYLLYFLNKIFYKKEICPSKAKIFIWDKIFMPFTMIIDFLFRYKIGKCILAVYKK